MVKKILCMALLAGVCALPRMHAIAQGAATVHLTITTEHSPPSAMQEGARITGFAAEKVHEMMARNNISYTMQVLPWKRAYQMALSQNDTCVFSTARTPERDKLFKWVGPTHETDWTLFGLASRGFKMTDLEQARLLRIGAYNGDVRGEFLSAQGFKVDSVQDRLSNPRKLLLGRIDLWATSTRIGNAIVAQNGWAATIVPVLTIRRNELYLACNPGVADATIERLNATLLAMNSDGTAARIEHRFDFWQAPWPAQKRPSRKASAR